MRLIIKDKRKELIFLSERKPLKIVTMPSTKNKQLKRVVDKYLRRTVLNVGMNADITCNLIYNQILAQENDVDYLLGMYLLVYYLRKVKKALVKQQEGYDLYDDFNCYLLGATSICFARAEWHKLDINCLKTGVEVTLNQKGMTEKDMQNTVEILKDYGNYSSNVRQEIPKRKVEFSDWLRNLLCEDDNKKRNNTTST